MSELTELFALDPVKHTDASLDELIEKLRAMRGQFALANDKKAGSMKPKKEAATKVPSSLSGLKLDMSRFVKKAESTNE